MISSKKLSAAALTLAVSQAVIAAKAPELEVTQVTATRTKQTTNEALAPVSVFSQADIIRLQAIDLADLLERTPGANMSASGSRGSASSLYMRGSNSGHTLFLIDGQRFNSATLGSTSFQFLNTEQIDRVEVLRGPRSSIYGSDAIGGVVQVFTKRGSDEPQSYVKAGAGSHDAWELAAGTSGKSGNTRYAFNLSQFETDGFDSFENITAPNDDDDGYRNSSISTNLGHDFDYGGSLDLNYYYSKSKVDIDDRFGGSTDPYSKSWIQTINATFATPVTDFWFSTVMLGNSIDDSDNYDKSGTYEKTDYRTTRDSANWQNDFRINDNHLLTAGVDYYDDQIDSSTSYVDTDGKAIDSRDNVGLFAIYQLTADWFDLQYGVREDDNEEYGKKTTNNVAAGFQIGEHHKIVTSYSEGYKVPTFNDLYYSDAWGFSYGNPNLKAEESEQYEIEFRGEYSWANWSLNVFNSEIDSLIEWGPVDPSDIYSAWTAENVDKAKIKGAEFVATAVVDGWIVNGSLNYIDATDDKTDKQLINRPKKFLSVDADKNFDRLGFGVSWRAFDESYGDKTNSQRMAGYGLVDLRASYQFTDALKTQLQLNNIFDKDYQNRYGYNSDDANWYLSLSYSM